MINVHNICLSFNNRVIFDHISLVINASDRIGLVGKNGAGKTTFLKAIIDPLVLDKGTITFASKKKIAYMPQEVVLSSTLSILEEAFSVFAEIYTLEKELLQIEQALSFSSSPDIMERYAFLQEQLRDFSVESMRARTKKTLMGLGFSENRLHAPVSSLSVGWKMRIVLAKLLLQEADFYLFDEPTNHLDLLAKEWFLQFLKQASFGFLIICHERYFLDELCEKTLELERGKATLYNGGYSPYCIQKEQNLKLLEAEYVQQQKEMARKRATIERFRASASKAKMASSMEKALEKMEKIELPPSSKTVHFSFPPVQQAGKKVLIVDKVAHAFGHKTIFQHVSFDIERGQKVALVAPNGVGKTTLFNLIAGLLSVQKGTITVGLNVKTALFAQDQNKVLNKEQSIINALGTVCPEASEQKIRTFLGSFLFSGEEVEKKIAVLSGGEKNRVGMVSVLLQNANFLLLDEPTNHLDIPSKEILLKALQAFNGTLLFVSHDRGFINALANVVVELTPQGVHVYHGNYDAYVYHKNYYTAQQKTLTPAREISSDKKRKNDEESLLLKKIKSVEKDVKNCECAIKKTEKLFEDLEYGTPAFEHAAQKLHTLKKELSNLEKEWELLQEEVWNKGD